MANTAPDQWGPFTLVSAWDGTALFNLAAISETITLEGGEKDWEYKVNVAGGRIGRPIPETDTILTFEGWQIGIGNSTDTTPTGLLNRYYGGTDSATPFSVDNYSQNIAIPKWQIFILDADDTATTLSVATAAITSGVNGKRYRFIEGRLISLTGEKWTGGAEERKVTMKFKFPARTSIGGRTITVEEFDGLASAAALSTLA